MTYGIAEGGFFPHQYVSGQIISAEGTPQQVFALVVGIHLEFRIYAHNIIHEIQIAERHSGLQRVYRDAPVCAEDIVHVQFAYPLGRLLLKAFRIGCKVSVFIAKQFIRDLTGEENADVRLPVDLPAEKIHSERRPDCSDIIGAK